MINPADFTALLATSYHNLESVAGCPPVSVLGVAVRTCGLVNSTTIVSAPWDLISLAAGKPVAHASCANNITLPRGASLRRSVPVDGRQAFLIDYVEINEIDEHARLLWLIYIRLRAAR